jgi:hypothetical protein
VASQFETRNNQSSEVNALQEAVRKEFDRVCKLLLPAPVLVSFLSLGSNGQGIVPLNPIKSNTTPPFILRRALVGMQLVAAVNLTDGTDAQLLFEQTLKATDQIRQRATANLSAKTILFILQG